MLDPFAPLKLIAMAFQFWMRRLGAKWLFGLMGLATIATLILGCRETYGT